MKIPHVISSGLVIRSLLGALIAYSSIAFGGVLMETDFEGSTSLPSGWTQNPLANSAAWNIQTGGQAGGGLPSSAYSGTNNATLYIGAYADHRAELLSPVFSTDGHSNITLTFWHTQPVWAADQDELKVQYSTDGGSTWTQLAHYTESVGAWTQRTLTIPTASATTQIKFEGDANYGYGICLDDIQVSGVPDIYSEISMSTTEPVAKERGEITGSWTITRIGDLTQAVSVNYALSGSATDGMDYNIDAEGVINFSAGEASKVITLTPIDDSVASEGIEIATLTLSTGAGYQINPSAASDDISIYDDEGYDLSILVIGSTHSFSEGGESGVIHEKPFNPATITAELQNILDNDSQVGTVNVVFEDIYKTKNISVRIWNKNPLNEFEFHCYTLAQHYFWPEGKADRLANLRGEIGTEWDYVVLMADPYALANFQGMYAEGMKLMVDEIRKGTAEPLIFAQWPENSSAVSALDFNEVAYRVGNSAGVNVIPAGKAWDTYTGQDASISHPTPHGAYLAAAGIYSKIFNRNAKASSYVYSDPLTTADIADHALSTIQSNEGTAQYTGAYAVDNVFAMKYVRKRVLNYKETGTSTENRISEALQRLSGPSKLVMLANQGTAPWDFNYGRGNDAAEDEKDYEVDPSKYDRSYGFPLHHYRKELAIDSMPYGIDKKYTLSGSYKDTTDLGIAYNMIRPGTRELGLPEDVRAIPIRLMWQKMAERVPGMNPLNDDTHMHNNLNDASAAFMFTLLTGRCPVSEEPPVEGSGEWMQWLGQKTGYETAWQMSHLTTRTPGFKILPSSAGALSVRKDCPETMTVQFMYAPQSDVTVSIVSSDASAAIVGPKKLVFTPANHNVPQQITVKAVAGSTTDVPVDIVFSTSSEDEIYNGLNDSWEYTIKRSTENVVNVDNGTSSYTTVKNAAIAIDPTVPHATATNTVLTGPNNGTLLWDGSRLVYTPDTNFTGLDGFAYSILVGEVQTSGIVEIQVVDSLPDGSVSIEVLDPAATEEGETNGVIQIKREGDTSAPLTVNFSLSGTAIFGSDYTISESGTVTMPADISSVDVIVTAIDDSVSGEVYETATITIEPGSGYTVINPAGTVTISDNENSPPDVDAGKDETVTYSGETLWTPASLKTSAWYDAADGSTITLSEGAVAQWDDKSGNDLHATQTSASRRPAYNAADSSLNNNPAIISPASDANVYLDIPVAAASRIYGIMYYGDGDVTEFDNDNAILSGPFAAARSNGVYRIGGVREKNEWSNDASYVFNSSSSWRNGDDTVNVTDGILPMPATMWVFNSPAERAQTWKVLQGWNWVSGWIGGVGELIFTDGTETVEERQKIEGYLAHKWGIETNLPAAHPYRHKAPLEPAAVVDLAGTVTDPDGDPVTARWSLVSGPGPVTFGDSSNQETTAAFKISGVYTLRLTATEMHDQSYDDVVITVDPTTYTLTYSTGTGGSISGNSTQTVNWNTDGTSVTAVPDSEYVFLYWSDGVSTATRTDAGVTADLSATAIFRTNYRPVVDAGRDQTVFLDNRSAPWTPELIATSAWYDAADASTLIESGGLVSQWNDKSGNGLHAVQTSDQQRPTYNASDSVLNGMPSISSASSSSNVFLNTPDAGAKRIYAIMYYGGGNLEAFDSHNAVLSGPESYGRYRATGSTGGNSWVSGHSFADQSIWKNGDDSSDASSGILPMPATMWVFNSSVERIQTWKILCGNNSSWSCWIGGVGELIFTDGSETFEDRQKIEGYLAHKWGIAANLPADHPYKDAASGIIAASASLNATAEDPEGDDLTTSWSVVSGPGSVDFSDSSALSTNVTFYEAGVYTLRLTADDGFEQSSDEVIIRVGPIDSLFTSWIAGFDVGEMSGFEQDADGDGIANSMELAFGTDPTRMDIGPLDIDAARPGQPISLPDPADGRFWLYFIRRTDYGEAGSLNYTPCFSNDLSAFEDDDTIPDPVANWGDYEVVKVPFPENLDSGGPARFGCIRISLANP